METAPAPEPSPEPLKQEPPPVVASLVLLNGGSANVKHVPTRGGKCAFHLTPKAGPNGKPAHVRQYTSLEQFHKEQADIAWSFKAAPIFVRLFPIDPLEGAIIALEAFIKTKQNFRQKLAAFRLLATALNTEIERIETEAANEPVVEEQVSTEPPPPEDTPRTRRAAELRRCGEEEVRRILREEYQITDVPVLNNFDGMIEAVLKYEAEDAFIQQVQRAESAPPPAAVVEVTTTATAPGAPHTEASLGTMPLDDLKRLGLSLGVESASRKKLVTGILEKQAKR